MTPETAALNPAETSGNSPPDAATTPETQQFQLRKVLKDEALAILTRHRPRRTAGLHIFDWSVYSLNNIVVFATSVAATYLTLRGGDRNAEGTLIHGGFGKFMHDRGDQTVKIFRWLKMPPQMAEDAKIVAWSFIDGSIFAVAVKLLENQRSSISKWIDQKLGTKHPDESVYDAEPKQTWKSVLFGRAATALVVVPTAIALEKTMVKGKNLNQHLFYDYGEKLGALCQKQFPNLQKRMGKLDLGILFRVSIFEAFYTTVCTIGLYFGSRFIARTMEDHEKKKELIHELKSLPEDDASAPAPATPMPPKSTGATPNATIAQIATQGRVNAAPLALAPQS